MTPKRIEYDVHAVDQMAERNISRDSIRWLLAQGTVCQADQSAHSEPVFARCGYLRGREAKVIYLENAERIYVITIMWVVSRAKVLREREAKKRRKD